jgi:predicted lactoylglutathione lyase
MIGYVTLGTNDLPRAAAFYDALLAEIGTVGNGVMVALGVDSRATVDRVYKKALELGGTDEGPAGPRGDDFYAGYFRDLDGNKLSVFCMG